MTLRAENFQKGLASLLTDGVQNLRFDGFLTLIANAYDRLGEFVTLTRYLERR